MSRQDELLEIESSQRQHFAVLEHEEAMAALTIKSDLASFEVLHPTITKDGDKWCVLYGNNLQDGIAGFGDTIHAAIIDFNGQFERKAAMPKIETPEEFCQILGRIVDENWSGEHEYPEWVKIHSEWEKVITARDEQYLALLTEAKGENHAEQSIKEHLFAIAKSMAIGTTEETTFLQAARDAAIRAESSNLLKQCGEKIKQAIDEIKVMETYNARRTLTEALAALKEAGVM